MYEALPAFLLRAPLLPERDLMRARIALERHPLGRMALELASAALAGAKDSAAKARTLERYGRRAAVRATPQGLLAGVCVGVLGRTTAIATGTPRAWLAPTWARMAGLGRALLDDASVRERVRVRVAPSLVRGATAVRWLGAGEPFAEEREAPLDEQLAAILDAARRFEPWRDVRRAAARTTDARAADAADLDDLLLLLVDDGLLQADVTPPLVGPPPATWMRARLGRLGLTQAERQLAAAERALARGALDAGAAALAALPGAPSGGAAAVQAVLVHGARRPPRLARAAVARAAGLAPLLFRLQDALAPPASERLAQPALDAALDAVTEIHGAGALDLEALAAGDYGVSAGRDESQYHGDDGGEGPPPAAPPAAILTVLVDALVGASRARRDEVALDVAALAAACGDVGPAPPPTCELFLAPAARRRDSRTPSRRSGAAEGAGWLLGLHAPAGATWGRFAAALGAPLARALEGLASAEREAHPLEEALDVAFAPSPALADLCTHPRVRRRVLAVSTWTDEPGPAEPDLALRDLALVADPALATPLALRPREGGGPVVPSPLARVRSSTAPAGATRLVCGWSLTRQHAPWALALGPLAALAHVPRLLLDGFVVAPASWRLPAPPARGALSSAALRRWRRAARVPRWVHVGHEDQLLAVDLDAVDGSGEALAGHERVWEIWPPLGTSPDRDGRRIEAVVALVNRPDADEAAARARAARATAAAGRVPPPRLAPPRPDFATFKIFGARAHQDAVLVGALAPALAAARRAREISGWFFLRYVDGPGRRHHLRLRVRVPLAASRVAFEARLATALAPTRAAGDVTTVETADYHPERARWGAALEAVHAIFQSDSELALALLGRGDGDGDGSARAPALVGSLDALARGLGLELPARHALARARRAAEEGLAGNDAEARGEADAEFRAQAKALRALLADPHPDPLPASRERGKGSRKADWERGKLDAHASRVGRATKKLDAGARAALAPALLHLACVRLAGPARDVELRAYTLWERTLEGLLKSPPRS